MLMSVPLSPATVDISDRKDYETAQKRMNAERIDAWKARVDEIEARRVEVEESKKQQELLIGEGSFLHLHRSAISPAHAYLTSSFPDITSHEIRNPTSAIIAATDLLRSNINDMLSKVTIGSKMLFTPESVATLEDDILVLDSIHQSATIQERLSNDILRLAQIDLELLQVFPMEVRAVPLSLALVSDSTDFIASFAAVQHCKRDETSAEDFRDRSQSERY
jgi:signal transduction histidine kinase